MGAEPFDRHSGQSLPSAVASAVGMGAWSSTGRQLDRETVLTGSTLGTRLCPELGIATRDDAWLLP